MYTRLLETLITFVDETTLSRPDEQFHRFAALSYLFIEQKAVPIARGATDVNAKVHWSGTSNTRLHLNDISVILPDLIRLTRHAIDTEPRPHLKQLLLGHDPLGKVAERLPIDLGTIVNDHEAVNDGYYFLRDHGNSK